MSSYTTTSGLLVNQLISLSAFVEVAGPDPKLIKSGSRPFHVAADGMSTFSVSGFVYANLHHGDYLVVCPSHALVPYLREQHRSSLAAADHFCLLSGTKVSVRVDGTLLIGRLDGFVCIEPAANLLHSLAKGGNDWSAAWLTQGAASLYGWMAVLGCTSAGESQSSNGISADKLSWTASYDTLAGMAIMAMGSPFGALSHDHFANHTVAGIIANVLSGQGGFPDILFADMHCLPGMEGGPVVDTSGNIVGVLGNPLATKVFKAEVPIVIPIRRVEEALQAFFNARNKRNISPRINDAKGEDAPYSKRGIAGERPTLARADCRGVSHGHSTTSPPGSHEQQDSCASGSPCKPTLLLQRAAVVAVLTGDGAWATGIVLCAQHGYLVTNAHLLSPRNGAAGSATPQQAYAGIRVQMWPQSSTGPPQAAEAQPIWASAEVLYVFQGPLDLAVLQISGKMRGDLQPVPLRDSPAHAGEQVFIMGYPLFPPRHNFGPCMAAGTVSKVVHEDGHAAAGLKEASMLITNATVHPGASGGAVMDGHGRLMGLVTSNARHSKTGASLPNLNFSLTTEALRPLWQLLHDSPSKPRQENFARLDISSPLLHSVWALTSESRDTSQGQGGGVQRLQQLLQQGGFLDNNRMQQGHWPHSRL